MKCPFVQNYTNDDTFTDVLSKKSKKGPCKYADGRCVGSLMNQKPRNSKPLDQNEILEKAEPSSSDVAELLSRVEKYVNSCGSTDDNLMHLPIAEAMVTYKEKRYVIPCNIQNIIC